MAKSNGFEDRIKSEGMTAGPVLNEDLVCADCDNRFNDSELFKNGELDETGRLYGPTCLCVEFLDGKPNDVLLGGECAKYEREG